MTLLLLQFNNYFNRKVKKYETIEDYISNSSKHHYYALPVNFNPNEQVFTEHIINWNLKWNPDYLLCIESDNTICGRWFITKSTRTRGGQFRLTLKRDTVAEKYSVIVNSPCFIQKGYVASGNPLIYNTEDFYCNQIKKREYIIKDNVDCSWIVLYYNLSQKAQLTGTITSLEEDFINTGADDLAHWAYYDYLLNGYKVPTNKEFKILTYPGAPNMGSVVGSFTYLFNQKGEFISRSYSVTIATLLYNILTLDDPFDTYSYEPILKKQILDNGTSISTAFDANYNPTTPLSTLTALNGKLIKFNNGKYYRVSIVPNGTVEEEDDMASNSVRNQIASTFYSSGTTLKDNWLGSISNSTIRQKIKYNKYLLTATEVSVSLSYTYDFTQCRDIEDAPYGILCLPYKRPRYGNIASPSIDFSYEPGRNATVEENVSMSIARDLIKKGTGTTGVLFDAQILPFCPITNLAKTIIGGIEIFGLQSSAYSLIRTEGASPRVIGFALHPLYAKFTNNIMNGNTITGHNIKSIISQVWNMNEPKVENQCNFARIVSPNFSGQYEFNIAKNGGLEFFNIDCTYKPYQPYIHINPNFGNLYGEDFNDPRGLVCGGDFGLTVINDAYEQYKLSNKNYQDIFNRQIQSMDTMNSIALTQARWQVATGAISGITSGATTGLMASGFNPAGAIVGGIVGGAASIAGGIADIQLQKQQQAEQISYATDMHNYQLDNIKATPDSLAKVDAFNNNFKIFPILEYYSCTEEEKQIFRDKITYDGMTINAVGKIRDYLGQTTTFIKGQLIRLDDLEEDNNFAIDIYNEISKGVYI